MASGAEPAAAGGAGRTPSSRRRSALSAVFVLVAVVAFGWALAGQWSQVADRLADQRPLVLAGSLVLALVGALALLADLIVRSRSEV